MRMWPLVALLCLPAVVHGGRHDPPIPSALVGARSVCLEGKTGNPRDMEELARELQSWTRLRPGPTGVCDVVIAIQHAGPDVRVPGVRGMDSHRDYLILTVWDQKSGDCLYRDIAEWSLFSSPIRSTFQRLRKRVEREAADSGESK